MLHRGELAFGRADFVPPLRGIENARGIFGVVAEVNHRRGHALHRPHQDKIEADEDQKRGQRGNEDGKRQDPGRKYKQRGADRVLVGDHHDGAARTEPGRRVDADDASRRREERADHVADLLDQIGLAAIIDGLDRRRVRPDKKQLMLAAAS